MNTANLIAALPQLEEADLNVKLVAVPSPQLFSAQPEGYRNSVITEGDKWDFRSPR